MSSITNTTQSMRSSVTSTSATTTRPPIRNSSNESLTNSNNQHVRAVNENIMSFPSTSTGVSKSCFRCNQRSATMRCLNCNALFCYDCCRKVTSECHLRKHTVLPIYITGVRPDSGNISEIVYCEFHAEPVWYYCNNICINLVCRQCFLSFHREHDNIPVTVNDTRWRTDVMKSLIISRGIGQAIAGCSFSISVKRIREPIFSFGSEGQDDIQVSRPWGICVDRIGNIIVADRRNYCIKIFSRGGELESKFGSKGTGPGEFDLPVGITTDKFDRIIVADKDNHRVQIFSMFGKFILKFGSFGKRDGQFQYPWDVAVNTAGDIVVSDTYNHRIQLFTSEGSYITKYVFNRINPITMCRGHRPIPRGVCFAITGNIAVSDFKNNRVLIVDSTLSKILYCIGNENLGFGVLDRPSGIVTDDHGCLIVAYSKELRMLVFDSELCVQGPLNLNSPDLDENDRPSDVALSPEGNLVVLFETRPACDVSFVGKHYIKVY